MRERGEEREGERGKRGTIIKGQRERGQREVRD